MTTDNDRLARAIEEVKAKINAFDVASTAIVNDMTAEVIEAAAANRQEIKTKMDAFMQSPKYLRAVEQGEQADALLAKQLAAAGMAAWTPSGTEELVELAYRLGIDTDPLTAKEIHREVVKAARELAATMTPVVEDPAIISHGNRSYSVGDAKPIVVTVEENAVLQEFLASKTAMSTKRLGGLVSNVARVIKQLERKFPGAVHRPETKGNGYFIAVIK
ncbi:MAG: hypothetical protein EXS16_12550 [Gemmataceae bacterium]|nr:hypothetical protein [Gemmataceae bacterium]